MIKWIWSSAEHHAHRSLLELAVLMITEGFIANVGKEMAVSIWSNWKETCLLNFALRISLSLQTLASRRMKWWNIKHCLDLFHMKYKNNEDLLLEWNTKWELPIEAIAPGANSSSHHITVFLISVTRENEGDPCSHCNAVWTAVQRNG